MWVNLKRFKMMQNERLRGLCLLGAENRTTRDTNWVGVKSFTKKSEKNGSLWRKVENYKKIEIPF